MFNKAMFFDKLAKLINKANLTQKEFCEKLNDQSKPYYYGIRQDTLSKMKNTRTAVPIEFVCAVSRFFNISIDELVGNEHQDKAECGLTFADLAHVFAILYKYFDFSGHDNLSITAKGTGKIKVNGSLIAVDSANWSQYVCELHDKGKHALTIETAEGFVDILTLNFV